MLALSPVPFKSVFMHKMRKWRIQLNMTDDSLKNFCYHDGLIDRSFKQEIGKMNVFAFERRIKVGKVYFLAKESTTESAIYSKDIFEH